MAMINFAQAYFVVALFVFLYSLLKERNEFGCSANFQIEKQCDNLKSVYLYDVVPNNGDSNCTLSKKLISLLSMHEKAAVWRKGFIVATIIIALIKVISPTINTRMLVALHLSIIYILYCYNNFVNFHVYRPARNIGIKIVKRLEHQCNII